MSDAAPQPQAQFEFRVSEELEGGVYANLISVWNTGHEFTLDFAATLQAEARELDSGETVVHVPARVMARVKLPVTVIFDLLQVINANMASYEEAYGPIRRPGEDQPLYPPDFEGGTDT